MDNKITYEQNGIDNAQNSVSLCSENLAAILQGFLSCH